EGGGAGAMTDDLGLREELVPPAVVAVVMGVDDPPGGPLPHAPVLLDQAAGVGEVPEGVHHEPPAAVHQAGVAGAQAAVGLQAGVHVVRDLFELHGASSCRVSGRTTPCRRSSVNVRIRPLTPRSWRTSQRTASDMMTASSKNERSKSGGRVTSNPSLQIGMSIRMQLTATLPRRSWASACVMPSRASLVAVELARPNAGITAAPDDGSTTCPPPAAAIRRQKWYMR